MEGISPRILVIHEAITEICSKALNAKDEQSAFTNICNTLVDRTICDAASIGIVDKGQTKVATIAQSGLFGFPNELLLSDLPEITRQRPYVSNDLTLSTPEDVWGAQAAFLGFLSMAVFPVKIGNNTAALLSVYSRLQNAFATEVLAVIEKLADVISDTLVRIKLDSQKRHAQLELQRTEGIYSRIAERIVGMICQVDQDRTIEFVSDSQRRVLGFEAENMIGKQLDCFIHPEFVDALDKTLRRAAQSHTIENLEVKMKRPNNQYTWAELVSDRVEDEAGHLSGFVIAIRDITETKEAVEKLQNQTCELERRLKERNERLRTLSETSSQKIGMAIGQVDHISRIRERLRKVSRVKSGHTLILKSAVRALSMEAGGIFVLNLSDQSVETKAMMGSENSTVKSTFSVRDTFVEFEALRGRDPITRAGGLGYSILGTRTIYCAPIVSSNTTKGFLAVGSDKRRTLDESELAILKLYAGLTADLLRSKSLDLEPLKETEKPTPRPCRVASGNAYLVPDNTNVAYELFLEGIMSGVEGLCISRTIPARIRERYDLRRTPIIWLTDEIVEGEKTIHSLQDLSIMVSNYVHRATKPIILIDGIEYLISHKGFESVYHFLQSKRTQVEASHGILIVPYFRDAIEAKEAKLLEREFRVFGAASDVHGMAEGPVSTQIPTSFY